MTPDSVLPPSYLSRTLHSALHAGERTQQLVVVTAAVIIAIVSARSYAGSWNDGSRLATVESLVDRHSFVIDESIFVRVPPGTAADPAPYPPADLLLMRFGTGDKLFINGHFYSDKSPVPALLMAGLYEALQWSTGLTAREQPARFCYWMTLLSSGLAYVVAVWCIFELGRPLRVPPPLRVLLTVSFGGATIALAYARQVNSHIQLLAVTAALVLCMAGLAAESASLPSRRLLTLGTLAGLGYTLDLGVGPVLLVGTFGVVVYRCRNVRAVGVFALAALPWLVLYHAVNYTIAGTLVPANAVSAYSQWPGSTLKAFNLTGTWKHTPIRLLAYGATLLVGNHGFLNYNLPLILVLVGFARFVRRRTAEFPEILFVGAVCVGTWLLYAAMSNNHSGVCVSIRWFVPLLALGYFVLAVLLRERPDYGWDLLLLSSCGAIVAGCAWWRGPWATDVVPFFWVLQVAALGGWFVFRESRGW